MVAATLAIITAGLVVLYLSDMIMPGVRIWNISLGGKTVAEATILIRQHWQQRTITLEAGPISEPTSPDELGLILDAATTAQLAYQRGRSLATIQAGLNGENPVVIEPLIEYNPAIAKVKLETLAPQFAVAPVNADIRLVEGRVEALPATAGQALDVAATEAFLAENIEQVITGGRLPLIVSPVLPAISDTSAVITEANTLLGNSITIQAYDPISDGTDIVTIEPAVWSEWLTLGLDPAAPSTLKWEVEPAKIQAYLVQQTFSLGPYRYLDGTKIFTPLLTAINDQSWTFEARVYHRARQHTIGARETFSSIGYDYGIPYPWIQAANPGIEDLFFPGQTITIPSPDLMLPLPIVKEKRIIVSISQQRMWAYEKGALTWEWPVSTGIPSSPTAPGIFQIQSHDAEAYAASWNLWMPHFMGIYRPVPSSHFMNGFHGFPTRGGSTLLWTGDLGHPVTYGCILVSSDNAVTLYNWADEGVVVEVRR
jgi:lipoprotein-anchoring transpeptidase ErfK/SrfK